VREPATLGSRRGREHVANTHLGEQVARLGWVMLDLASQAIDVDLEQVALTRVLFAPDVL